MLYARKVENGSITTANLYNEGGSGFWLIFDHNPGGSSLDYHNEQCIQDEEEAIHAFAVLVNENGLEIW